MASQNQPRGAFIVLEGADRAGKSTQCQMLVEHLTAKGVAAELWRFPDRTTAVGKMINSYLTSQSEIDDAAVHLLFSANRWEKREELLRKLHAGTTLVVDRYAYSGVAFTAAKGLPGLDRAWCMAPDAGLPAPDAVFFLSLTVEAAEARGGYGEERYEKAEFQRKVLDQFAAMRSSSWRMIDASQPIDAMQRQLREQAAVVVARCQRGTEAVGKLWESGAVGGAPLTQLNQ
ncbi:hypothetical protein D9Q98_000983 [Chlorella vulgaris]|uniref:Thymidylate kinase n=1 Tax=Chlorella vulgaris TaxID=3077 RepID=A0A9D4TZQ3_CHLVU|nr:hypothetical protein D9Q98_000983 [Chlorella vulgaris]